MIIMRRIIRITRVMRVFHLLFHGDAMQRRVWDQADPIRRIIIHRQLNERNFYGQRRKRERERERETRSNLVHSRIKRALQFIRQLAICRFAAVARDPSPSPELAARERASVDAAGIAAEFHVHPAISDTLKPIVNATGGGRKSARAGSTRRPSID